MSLQYISDNKGQTTGVFIPIEEWNNLKNKFKGIEDEELDNRVKDYRKRHLMYHIEILPITKAEIQ